MNQEAIALSELRTAVFEVVNTSAIPPRDSGAPVEVETLLELSSRTGLNLERRNGMAPLRTVGDIIDFSLQRAAGNDTLAIELASEELSIPEAQK
jgi:hypothetical protein